MVTPPATPDGGCLLRCSVSAGHSPEQIKKIGNGFASLKEVVRETETA
jgi:8-amino-7-oxononanoate synthase